jgi:hypothetical protein
LTSAIKTVEGVTVVVPPKPGTGPDAVTLVTIESPPKVALSKVVAAIEAAKTPHAAQVPPGVAAVTSLRFKPDVTMDKIHDALKKADLLEE